LKNKKSINLQFFHIRFVKAILYKYAIDRFSNHKLFYRFAENLFRNVSIDRVTGPEISNCKVCHHFDIIFSVNFNSLLYEINEPFLMKDQIDRLNRRLSEEISSVEKSAKRSRGRKNCRQPHAAIQEMSDMVENQYRSIIDLCHEKFIVAKPPDKNHRFYDGNTAARSCLGSISIDVDRFWSKITATGDFVESREFKVEHVENGSKINSIQEGFLYKNDSRDSIDFLVQKDHVEMKFYMPKNSSFIIGDVYKEIHHLAKSKIQN